MSKRESDSSGDVSVKKRRKSRWEGSEKSKCFLPGMPTQLPSNLSPLEEESYLIQLQIEDISRRLRNQDYSSYKNNAERSPSPEPIYNNEGKRVNTRDMRARQKLEGQRHKLVQRLMVIKPEYKPPVDYRVPNNREVDKVFIPQDEHPELNFVGLLIGPRGNTLKSLEKETGAKIIIRGRGSVKDGKVGGKDGLPLPGEDEPLHAYITAPIRECVEKAIKRIKEIIQEGVEIPENQNDLRKSQMKELALLNGTFREVDGLNKLKMIAEAQTIVTNTIICSLCGGVGHIPSDCKIDRKTMTKVNSVQDNEKAKMDSEYTALMEELGVEKKILGFKLPPKPIQNSVAASLKPSSAIAPFHDERPSTIRDVIYPFRTGHETTFIPSTLPPPPPPAPCPIQTVTPQPHPFTSTVQRYFPPILPNGPLAHFGNISVPPPPPPTRPI